MNTELNNSSQLTGEGYLRVRVSTARGAIPLPDAIVNISSSDKDNSGILASAVTDADGLTPKISLPAPPRQNSQQPNTANPYSNYNIEVALPGFYSQFYTNVPVFDGIAAIQSAELKPLAKNGNTDNYTYQNILYFEGENTNL